MSSGKKKKKLGKSASSPCSQTIDPAKRSAQPAFPPFKGRTWWPEHLLGEAAGTTPPKHIGNTCLPGEAVPTQGHVFSYSLSPCPKEPPRTALSERDLATAACQAVHQRRLNFDVERVWTCAPYARPCCTPHYRKGLGPYQPPL